MVNPASVVLLHLRMNIEAGVSQLSDFLGKEFHSFGVFAEDDCLVDVKFRKESV
jgi:hypothetical protein